MMRRIVLLVLVTICSLGLSACEQEQIEEEENTYESPYVKDYDFSIPVLNEVYYNYNDVFAGIYLVGSVYNINVTNDAPETLIAKLEQTGSIMYQIVDHSYAELWTVREIVTSFAIEMEGFTGIGISEMDNSVMLTLQTDTVVPEKFGHYIEIGILTIEFINGFPTF